MTALNGVAILFVLTGILGFVNKKWLRLPMTLGLTLMSLAAIALLWMLDLAGSGLLPTSARAMASLHFSDLLLKVVLGFLLFAGALHIDLHALWEQRYGIAILSTLGVLISTLVVAMGSYALFWMLGLYMPFSMCLLFGALISPTDPIAVLALLKETSLPRSVEMNVAGESLLNDGVAVVLFLSILGVVSGTAEPTLGYVITLLLREVIGGIVFGIALGLIAYQLLKRIDDYQIEIHLSLAVVVGGYALAQDLHVSGALAMVAAGLIIGNTQDRSMSETTRKNLGLFWEVIDGILNAALFALVGFSALLLDVQSKYFVAGAISVALVLAARYVSVWLSSRVVHLTGHDQFDTNTITILTWGGLRGGICLALALALPQGESREVLLFVTYLVVIFSLLVQGLTMKRLLLMMGITKEPI